MGVAERVSYQFPFWTFLHKNASNSISAWLLLQTFRQDFESFLLSVSWCMTFFTMILRLNIVMKCSERLHEISRYNLHSFSSYNKNTPLLVHILSSLSHPSSSSAEHQIRKRTEGGRVVYWCCLDLNKCLYNKGGWCLLWTLRHPNTVLFCSQILSSNKKSSVAQFLSPFIILQLLHWGGF